MSRLLVVSGKTWEAWGYFTLEETEVPSLRCVMLSLLDRITERSPKPYNRLAPYMFPWQPMEASCVAPSIACVHIYMCGGGRGSVQPNIHSHPSTLSIKPTQVQGQGQVLLTAVSSVQRTEPERKWRDALQHRIQVWGLP